MITAPPLCNASQDNPMTHPRHGLPPETWLSDTPSPEEVRGILEFLNEHGTFRFPTLSSGLFSAAAAENPEFRLTGYQNVWTRDNCHIAHALWVVGQKEAAARAITSLLEFYRKHSHRFSDVIEGRADHAEPSQRPHIRFDGESLSELDVRWAHAQNDALGYVLWLSCRMMHSGDLPDTPADWQLFGLFLRYFQAIEFWADEDSGHWEETRKIEASSIGTVLAGLRELRRLAEQRSAEIDLALLDDLAGRGKSALHEILPAECIQSDPSQNRRYDAALLFLIYPLDVVDSSLADQILHDVAEHLTADIGIRRYLGDSYWCADYRDLLAPEVRTTDFSDDTSARDSLLKPGEEAQWCIFDPIISVIYGSRYQRSGQADDLQRQVHHLRRSLRQLTTAESRFSAYRCPESYFLEHGHWIPNDITPLLWTQANLRLALHSLERSVAGPA